MVNTSTLESRVRRFMDQISFKVIFRVSLVLIYFFISLVSVSYTYAYTYTYQYKEASVHYPHKRLPVLSVLGLEKSEVFTQGQGKLSMIINKVCVLSGYP